MLFKAALEEYLNTIEEEDLRNKCRYALDSNGKYVRPILFYFTLKKYDLPVKKYINYSLAIEMVHTYSLIHDDLQAMDDDSYRRGRKTTHVVYGEAMGILAGDALLNFAFETASQAFFFEANPLCTARAMQILSKKSGIYGMLGGQVVDVQNEGRKEVNSDTLDFIYRLKTGALLESSMMIGAVLAGAKDQEVSLLEQAAGKVGVAFQIQDDILDVTSTLEELGKPVGSDEKNEKNTYVSVYGMQAAQDQVRKLTNEAVCCMKKLPVKSEFLNDLLIYLVRRRS